MTWVKIDDEFYTHPKVANLRSDVMLACVGLNTLALCWCNHKLTDGLVPLNQVFRLAGDLTLALPSGDPQMLINELVRVDMWEVAETDANGYALAYRLHDYLDYQPSKAEHQARQAEISQARSDAGKKGAAARWATSVANGKTTPYAGTNNNAIATEQQTAWQEPSQTDGPVPVPKTLRSKDLSKPAPKPPAPSDEFDSFWSIYPRKEAKGAAVRAYKAALRKASPPTIREALEAQLPELCMRERQFVPLPATWLNAERWADDLAGQDTHGQRVARLRHLRKEHGDERVRAMCEDEGLWQEVCGHA